jgi:hypothetical protein
MQSIILFGFEEYMGARCAIAEFKFNDLNLTTKIWVDTNKGTLLKTINEGRDSNNKKYELTDEYVATYNVVTDEDVRKPELTDYSLI